MNELKPGNSILTIGIIAYSIFLLFFIGSNKHNMWDFKLRLWGAISYSKGLNPLESESLKKTINEVPHKPIFHVSVLSVGKEFALLPLFFRFYSLFLKYEIETLYYSFLAIKLISMNLLFFLWFKYILPIKEFRLSKNPLLNSIALLLIIIFSWNRTIFMDVEAGNVSVTEQIFIWLGVLFYLRKKLVEFAVCIAFSSLWKIVPISFLFLLFPFFIEKRERAVAYLALLSGLGIFILFHLVSYLLDPEIYFYYLKALPHFSDEERGVVNPCIIALIGEGSDYLIRSGLIQMDNFIRQSMIYFVYSIFVGITSFLYFRSYCKSDLQHSQLKLVLFTFLAFAIVAPRFKDYSYILLIPSAIYLLAENGAGIEEKIMLFILTLFPPMFPYYPYFLVWIFFLYFMWRQARIPAGSGLQAKKLTTF